MLQLAPQQRILLARDPVDFRRGVDALSAFCRNELGEDPFDGTLFVFRNRAATSIRSVHYDGQGFWLCTKRWSKGRLTWWPTEGEARLHPLAARELAVLLYNGDPSAARFAPDWRRLP